MVGNMGVYITSVLILFLKMQNLLTIDLYISYVAFRMGRRSVIPCSPLPPRFSQQWSDKDRDRLDGIEYEISRVRQDVKLPIKNIEIYTAVSWLCYC